MSLEEAESRLGLNSTLRKVLGNQTLGDLDTFTTSLEDFIVDSDHQERENSTSYRKRRSAYSVGVHSFAPATPTTGKDYHTDICSCISTRSKLDFLVLRGRWCPDKQPRGNGQSIERGLGANMERLPSHLN